MILTVCLNPAVDKTCTIDRLQSGEVNRLESAVSLAGGKGVNVAKVLRAFSMPVAIVGFLGGMGGKLIEETLEKLGVEIVYNHADCRLMSRRALEELSRYKETNLFLRGMVPHMGFKQDVVYFKRQERFAGESKYPLSKMLTLAWQGVTSFSVKPLKLITAFGIAITLLSLFGLLTQGILALCGIGVGGLLPAVTSLWLLGGILLIALGLVGSYVGKLYEEVKARPRFAFEKELFDK